MTMAKKPFDGATRLDVRGAMSDWDPHAPWPTVAPNILVLFEDMGLAAWSCFGAAMGVVLGIVLLRAFSSGV
jgi:hypothetical protein